MDIGSMLGKVTFYCSLQTAFSDEDDDVIYTCLRHKVIIFHKNGL